MSATTEQIAQATEAARRGDTVTAERICRAELDSNPQNPDALLLLGTIEAMRGEADVAALKFEKVIELQPERASAHYNLGLLRYRQRRNQEALPYLERTLALDPTHRGARAARAHALFGLARWPEAVAALQDEAAREPQNVDIWIRLGLTLQALRDHERAFEAFRNALGLRPRDPVPHRAIGATLLALGRFDEAIDALSTALDLDGNLAGAALDRAVAFRSLGQTALAIADYERALRLAPDDRRLLSSYVEYLQSQNEIAAAEGVIERARASNALGADVTLGNLRADQMRNDEALDAFDAALASDPDDTSARWSRSLVLLRLGRLAEGFREFEHRLGGFVQTASQILPGPEWSPGSGQPDKRLLLYAEQGLGDTIQFVRFAKLLQEQGHEVAVLPPRALVRLCRSIYPNVAVLDPDRPLAPFDAHCSLLSLPAKLGIEIDTIPATVPYLSVDDAAKAQWRARLPQERKPFIGICWSGSPTHKHDSRRSIPFKHFQLLTEGAEANFVSLVKDVRPSERAPLASHSRVLDVMSQAGDLYDTAALTSALDLVITVDTSIAHLAGALGKPVWILLPFAPDWRWLTDRTDSSWYPTARLFRQTHSGDWDSVLTNVRSELESYLRA